MRPPGWSPPLLLIKWDAAAGVLDLIVLAWKGKAPFGRYKSSTFSCLGPAGEYQDKKSAVLENEGLCTPI